MSISDIVNVTITRETPVLTQVGFGTLLIVGETKVFNDRINVFNSLEELTDAGFSVTSNEYIASASVFAQNPNPGVVAIGRRNADNAVVTVTVAVDGDDYSVKINGVTFTYTALVSSTTLTIATGLVTLINGGTEPVTATDNNDGTFDIDPDIAGVSYSLISSDNLTFVVVPDDTITNDLLAISNESDDFYGIMILSRAEADVLEVAAFAESRLKLFGVASDDADILTALTTDLASQLKALNYARTFVLYHSQAATIYPEAAWFGRQLSTAPGSSTWAFKLLTGIPVSTITSNERANALGKNANTYELRGGANITREGKVAVGEFIDVIRGSDWLKTRMTERVFARLVSSPKIPYTDAGVALIESDVRAQLDQAIAQGVIALDPSYTVTVPLVRNVNPSDRANRFLPDVKFVATLASAIHSVSIQGVLRI